MRDASLRTLDVYILDREEGREEDKEEDKEDRKEGVYTLEVHRVVCIPRFWKPFRRSDSLRTEEPFRRSDPSKAKDSIYVRFTIVVFLYYP